MRESLADLKRPPCRAQMAFAARAARRFQPFTSRFRSETAQGALREWECAITFAERVAAGLNDALTERMMLGSSDVRHHPQIFGALFGDAAAKVVGHKLSFVEYDILFSFVKCVASLRLASSELSPFVDDLLLPSFVRGRQHTFEGFINSSLVDAIAGHEVFTCNQNGISSAQLLENRSASSILETVRKTRDKDLGLLFDASDVQSWNANSHVPLNFFPLRMEFLENEAQISPASRGIICVADEKLLSVVAHNPDMLLNMNSRRFEQFIGHILKECGFDVELTAATRDGGYDILAVSHTSEPVKLIIECKRYHKQRVVGVNYVRALHGSVIDTGATKGILVTTGKISLPACQYLQRHSWQLEGRDMDSLLTWLNQYRLMKDRLFWTPTN